MKEERMNRRTAPISGKIHLSLPTSWSELSDDQLRYIVEMACSMTMEEVQHYFFARLVTNQDSRAWLAPGEQLGIAMETLDWMQEPPEQPVRLAAIGGVSAVDVLLHGVPFSHYIMIENYYQGFVISQQPQAIDGAASLLYPGLPRSYKISDGERYSILMWLSALKSVFSQEWPHFFRKASDDSELPDMKEVMNAEIRALTGGDVTKEEVVQRIDCWRALTELDEKAREAAELASKLNQG